MSKPISQKYLSHRLNKIREEIIEFKFDVKDLLARTNELLSYIAYMMVLKENPSKTYNFTKQFKKQIEDRINVLLRRFDP